MRRLSGEEERVEQLAGEVPGPLEVWEGLVKDHPGDVVLSDMKGMRLARAEVDDQSNRVNAYLRDRGIGCEDVVLIRLDRGVAPFIVALGAWKAGAAFCMVESDYAPERISFIAKDCDAKIEFTQDMWPEVLATKPSAERAEPNDHDACMFVYTSGTTGTPKGALHEYGQVKLEILSETQQDGKTRQSRKTRWAIGAPLNFVATLKIFVHFIYSGGHLYVLDLATVKDPRKLDTFFLTHRINETFLAPSHLRAKGGDLGPFVKVVYCGAAPVDNVSLKRGMLVNNYSMSESLFTITDFIVDKPYDKCPIGNPSFDLGIRLLAEDGTEVARGEAGEICFPNPFFRGYVNRPEENAERFENGLFHSRDIARLSNDGLYAMAGRVDDMVKVNGNRVEPAEIEHAFKDITGINCVVKCFADDEALIVLYYVRGEAATLNLPDVRAKLEKILPDYMIPRCFESIDSIPLTPLGKVDRKLLTRPSVKRVEYVAPQGEFEQKLAASVAKALNLDRVGRNEDLFELGASSNIVIEVLANMDLPGLSADMFYRCHSIEGIARLYEETMGECSALNMKEEEMELEGRKHIYPLRDSALILYSLGRIAPDQTDSLNLPQAFKLSRLVNIEKMCNAINEYTSKSSTFQTIVVEDENGEAFYKYAPELYRPVEVEHMSKAEVEKLIRGFVQPFRPLEELPWRVRLVKTLGGNYLFFDIHHILTDGEGISLMAADILNLYQGKEARPNNFFSWLYRENVLYASAYFKECERNMRNRFDNVAWTPQPSDPTEEIGLRSKEYDTGVSLSELDAFMRVNNRSRGDLLAGALALAMREMTDGTDIALGAAYANRTGVENVAGVRVRILTLGFNLQDMPETYEGFLDIASAEMREGIANACYCYRYRTEGFDGLCPLIDDLEDLEEPHPLLKKFATPLDLGRAMDDGIDTNTEPSAMTLVLMYFNRDGKLWVRVKRDVHFLSDEARDRFAQLNIDALHHLMAGGRIS